MNEKNTGEKPLILIIDDSKENLHYLCDIFKDYRKAVTISGIEGIKLANSIKPDLILLDILMPEIDGFEVCRRIKENENNKDIPIIFLSGKTSLEDVVKGFQIGAVDYITKPFEQDELLIRVRNNLELKASKDVIKFQNQIMSDLNRELKYFLAIATHDLKNSLVVIQGFSKLLNEHFNKFSEEEKNEILSDIIFTSEMMFKIIMNLSMITKLEENMIKPYYTEMDINFLILDSVNYFRELSKNKDIHLILINKIKQISIVQDYSLVKECIDNVISNAVKFSPFGSSITIKAYSETLNKSMEPKFIIEIEDEGQGIKPSEQPLIFKKFAKLSSLPTNREPTTGLGLAITKLLIDLLCGEIEFTSEPGKGSKFILKFPVNGTY